MKLFENGVGRPSNEIKKKRKIFVAVISAIVLIALALGTYMLQSVKLSNLEGASAKKKESIIRQREAVLTVARAYLSQGKQLQYDSYRKNLSCTPEDTTSKHTCYTVCSGLVYMSYKQALNMELPINVDGLLDKKNAKIGKKTIEPRVIFYTEGDDARTKFQTFLENKEDLKTVRAGDILVWTGHTMLVESIGENSINVIHATGVGAGDKSTDDGDYGRYDTFNQKEHKEPYGAIQTKTITKDNIKNAEEIAILRYIYSENDITSATKTRLKYPEISIAKIISNVEDQSFTTPGSKLTYQIRIRNNSDETYKNITVQEKITSEAVELIGVNLNKRYLDSSINKKLNDSKKLRRVKELKWEIPEIKPGKYVTLQYTVKVKNSVKKNTIITSTGKIGNIATSKIETLVGNKLTKNETNKLKECFENYDSCFENSSLEISKLDILSGRKFINTLYKASLGIDIGISGIDDFSVLFTYNNKKIKLKNSMSTYLYSNFYGLRIKDYTIDKSEKNNIIAIYDKSDKTARANAAWKDIVNNELEERARTINSSMLIDGDVIITYSNIKTVISDKEQAVKAYIYLNEALHRYRNENGKISFEKIEGSSLDDFLADLVGDNYIILRPYSKNLKSISISKSPNKTTYEKGAKKLNLSGGKLRLKYDDGSTKEISLKNPKVKVTGFNNKTLGKNKITVEYEKMKTSFNIKIIEKTTTKKRK